MLLFCGPVFLFMDICICVKLFSTSHTFCNIKLFSAKFKMYESTLDFCCSNKLVARCASLGSERMIEGRRGKTHELLAGVMIALIVALIIKFFEH